MQSKHTWQQGMIKMGGVGGHMLLCCWCGRSVNFCFLFPLIGFPLKQGKQNPRRWSNSLDKRHRRCSTICTRKEGARLLGAWTKKKTHDDKGEERKKNLRWQVWRNTKKKKKKNIQPTIIITILFFLQIIIKKVVEKCTSIIVWTRCRNGRRIGRGAD